MYRDQVFTFVFLFAYTVELKVKSAGYREMQMRCKVLCNSQCTSVTEWKSIVSSDMEYDSLDMSFCAVFALSESNKWKDVIQSFPKAVVEAHLLGIVLVNFKNNLTLSDKFFEDENHQDMFVCVVSHSNLEKIQSFLARSFLEARARVVYSTSVDMSSSRIRG